MAETRIKSSFIYLANAVRDLTGNWRVFALVLAPAALLASLCLLPDALNLQQIDIDPFLAGIFVLGFIYGAYFTETFRGGVLAVPKGQLEAAAAYGLTRWQTFRRILFPQMMRFALPGISNNWQVILKATALVSIIGLHEVVRAAQDAITGTSSKGAYHAFFFLSIAGVIYLVLTTISNLAFMVLERRYSIGIRKPEL